MKRDERLFVEDIVESLALIKTYSNGVNKEAFLENHQLQDAVLRRFEVIGEAAKQISEETRNKYPNVPWKRMAGLRDVLIHQYFVVSLIRVWNIIEKDLDEIIGLMEHVLNHWK